MKVILKQNFYYGLIALIAIYLLSYNIGQTPFWDDEAMVSWFGKIFSENLSLVGYDGYNGFMYRNGSLFYYKNPPLDIIYSALIQKYIGSGEIIERAMFVIFSACSIILYYFLTKKLYRLDFWNKIAFVLFVLNINFLLFGNESRYYPFTYFFGIVLYLILLNLEPKINKKQILLQISIAIFVALFFLAHYTQALVWFILIIHFLLTKFNKQDWNKFKVLFIAISLTIVFFIWYSIKIDIMHRADLANLDNTFLKYLKLIYWYFTDLHRFCILSLLGFLPFLFKKFRTHIFNTTENKFLTQQILIFSTTIIFTSPQDTSQSSMFDMRYIQSGLFLFAMFNTNIFHTLFHIRWIKKWQIICLVILMTTTNLIYYIPLESPIRMTTIGLFHEKNTDYSTPFKKVQSYLDTVNNVKTRTIASIPEFNNTLILRFYSHKFKTSNCLINNSNLSDLTVSKYYLENNYITNIPDLVILYGRNEKVEKQFNIDLRNYSKVDTIKTFANGGMDYSRPEFAWHSFHSSHNFDINREAIYILRK